MPHCINLRELFGDQFKIEYDESYDAERAEFRPTEEVWLQQIPCQRGHICPWGGEFLAACTNGPGPTARKLMALPFIDRARSQNGDDGANVVFHVRHFAAVAAIVQPKRKRRLSPEQRQRLIEVGKAHRFLSQSHGVEGDSDKRQRVGAVQSDSQAIPAEQGNSTLVAPQAT